MHTGQHIRTDSGSSWFFDAGRIALDFAHTGGFADDPDGRRPRSRLGELLMTPADLDEWLSEHTEPIDVGANARELQDARALRAAIGRLAVGSGPRTGRVRGGPGRRGGGPPRRRRPHPAHARRHRHRQPVRRPAGRAPEPPGWTAPGRRQPCPAHPGAVERRPRRRVPVHRGRLRRRRGRRPTHPAEPVLGAGLRAGVLRLLARRHPSLVRDAAVRQPRQGARRAGAARPPDHAATRPTRAR